MSEDTQEDSVSGRSLSREVIAEMLQKNFQTLPDIDQKLFSLGPLYLGGNAALGGLISNSLCRRALHVRQAAIVSSLSVGLLSLLTTRSLYNMTVSTSLLNGDLNCPICCQIRGALVGVVGGGVYPILLALALNIGLAKKYNTSPMPEKGNALRYLVDISRPITRKMRAVMLLQGIFGTYLASRNFESYIKLARLTAGLSEEELKHKSVLN